MPVKKGSLLEKAKALDLADPLFEFREHFYLPDGIYLAGNSLGLQPKSVSGYVNQELLDWQRYGVEGHTQAKTPWVSYHETLSDSLARLVGAKKTEVVAMNTLTVNLHLMLATFYRPSEGKNKILTAAKSFPSDRYAIESVIQLHGRNPEEDLIVVGGEQGIVRLQEIREALQKGDVALVLMDGLNYYSGQRLPMQEITELAHQAGALVGFDLAHGVGNFAMQLHDWNTDFAVWCSYKYLNGGPGCVGGAFIHENHGNLLNRSRLAGWWGHNKESRFAMPKAFEPIPGAEGYQLSNPPILPLAALRASLEIFDSAGIERLEHKSQKLTQFLLEGLPEKVEVLTPASHGSQISLLLNKNVFNRLRENQVFADFREPGVVRVAPVPLYNRFEDLFRFVSLLDEVL